MSAYATNLPAKAKRRIAEADPYVSLECASSNIIRKVPPQNLEAEQAVLGGIFLKNNILHTVIDQISADDFYFPVHRIIFAVFLDLYAKNIPIDLVTVAEHLKQQGRLEEVGGAIYLAELAQGVIAAANAPYHARIVRDKAVQRELIGVSTEIISSAFDNSVPVEQLIDDAEQAVFAVAQRTSGATFLSSDELVKKVFADLEKRAGRSELVTGVPTGYHRLNEITAGFQPSDLIIVAGRPSMGKTAFALNIAMRAAVMDHVPVIIYSLEMSQDQLMQRMLCAWGKVDLSRLRRGFLDDEDWTRLYAAANALSPAPIYIDDTPVLGSLELRARSRRLKMEKNISLVVVDYLQLMRVSRRFDSREQEISEISRNLKALAKEICVPVIALSQLNRKLEERSDKRPMLSDLRESGAIEQDADLIMFVYRDEVYNKREDNPKRGIAEIIIGKQRNGPTGIVELSYLNRYTAFEELETQPPSEYLPRFMGIEQSNST
ncbi:replicative DNA helicase [Desulfovibrionales bacterium]